MLGEASCIRSEERSLRRIKTGLTTAGWVAVVAAPLATHAAIATGRFAIPAAILAMVEVAVLAALALRAARGWARAAGAACAGLVLLGIGVRMVRPSWAGPDGLVAAAWASHALIYGSLLLLFGRSLRPGNAPLATAMAARLRGTLTPAIMAYTRNVTKAWCVFFIAQVALSGALLLLAPRSVWSLFVNVLDGPSVLAMFAGEYALRRWRFRDERHISPFETVRSFARSRAAGP